MDGILFVVVTIVALGFILVKGKHRNGEEPDDSPWKHLPEDMYTEPRVPATPEPAPKREPLKNPTQNIYHTEPQTHSPTLEQLEDEDKEFDINSLEEVRRGIIWSEILSRKY